MNQRPGTSPLPKLTGVEAEVVFLKSANDVIDGMVNREMLTVHDDPGGATVLFSTMTHQRLFNVLLVDFLSKTDDKGPVAKSSFLGALRFVAECPHFDSDGSVSALREPVQQFRSWLHATPAIGVWFPSLDLRVQLSLARISFLKMCGDIAKHDLLRAVRVAEQLQRALKASEVEVELDDVILALDDFYQRFHTDILNYHGTYIVELLNNIRWGIHEYLLPEFRRSYTPEGGEPPRYSYKYPPRLLGKFARSRYWDLMNDVRSGPILPRFSTASCLKQRY